MNRENYLVEVKESFLQIPGVLEQDVDLLVYYLKSSLDEFVKGDLERSFMDSFKIVFDNHGKSFQGIYKMPEDNHRYQHYADIRDCLSHAKHTPKDKNQLQEERLLRLKAVKKNLFAENKHLLSIVKTEYIDEAFKKVPNSKLVEKKKEIELQIKANSR